MAGMLTGFFFRSCAVCEGGAKRVSIHRQFEEDSSKIPVERQAGVDGEVGASSGRECEDEPAVQESVFVGSDSGKFAAEAQQQQQQQAASLLRTEPVVSPLDSDRNLLVLSAKDGDASCGVGMLSQQVSVGSLPTSVPSSRTALSSTSSSRSLAISRAGTGSLPHSEDSNAGDSPTRVPSYFSDSTRNGARARPRPSPIRA
mmetsp:Transcript_38361/g.90160  ORF Transcript_38361/g.90160 Transcript_38361/m.90160 type:complete len:201 (-) Transcript_38361:185-787(-)